MHRSDRVWLALVFVLPLLLVSSAQSARAQGSEGDLDVTDTDPTAVRLDVTHPALAGGGDALWEGGALVFPAEDDGSGGDGNQVYRSVAAALQAPLPENHDGTVEITVSVRVSNDGPDDGVGFVGGLKLYEDGDPEDFDNRTLDSHNIVESAPSGHVETLTVSAQVPAEDLAAGNVFIHLATETFHGGGGNTGTQWTADQLVATYAAEPVPALPPLAYVLLVALLAAGTLWTLRRARV